MLTLEDWRQQGDYFQFQSHRLFYSVRGDDTAPCLVLLHGFPTSSYDWQHILPFLERKFFVISLDFLGFGLSDKPEKNDYSIKTQADAVESLLSLLGIDQAHLLAHDYGDSIAQELVARDIDEGSDKILSLILLNGGIFPEIQQPVLLQRLLLGPLGPLVARLTSFKRFKKNFDKICAVKLDPQELQTYWQLLCRNQGIHRIPKIIQYIKERRLNRDRWVGSLENAGCPLMFINGLQDPVSGKQMVAKYRELVPAPVVVELSNIGHYPQVESPQRVLAAAFTFWFQHIDSGHVELQIDIDESAELEL